MYWSRFTLATALAVLVGCGSEDTPNQTAQNPLPSNPTTTTPTMGGTGGTGGTTGSSPMGSESDPSMMMRMENDPSADEGSDPTTTDPALMAGATGNTESTESTETDPTLLGSTTPMPDTATMPDPAADPTLTAGTSPMGTPNTTSTDPTLTGISGSSSSQTTPGATPGATTPMPDTTITGTEPGLNANTGLGGTEGGLNSGGNAAPQLDEDTPEYAAVELIKKVAAGKTEGLAELISPSAVGMIKDLKSAKSGEDEAMTKAKETISLVKPINSKKVGRDQVVAFMNDKNKVLQFYVRKVGDTYGVRDLKVREAGRTRNR